MNFLKAGEVHEYIKNDDHIIISRFLADWINKCIAGVANLNDIASNIKEHSIGKEILLDEELDHDDYFKGENIPQYNFPLHIIWGECQEFQKSYCFKTNEERTSFIYGINETKGYYESEYFFSKPLFNDRIDEISKEKSESNTSCELSRI